MKKYLLTDVDGVLLDWEGAFRKFMIANGFDKIGDDAHYYLSDHYGLDDDIIARIAKDFNSSNSGGNLKPIKNSNQYLKKFIDLGYEIIAITSFGTCSYSRKNRLTNLKNAFGDIFKNVILLNVDESKKDVLKDFKDKNSIWIEDKYQNYKDGCDLGIESYLMKQPYNKGCNNANFIEEWSQLYNNVAFREK